MNEVGMRKGQKYEVLVVSEELILGSVEHVVYADDAVKTSVFVEDEEGLVSIYEALLAAATAVSLHVHKPELQGLLAQRLEELGVLIAEEESEPPSPTDDLGDIPF